MDIKPYVVGHLGLVGAFIRESGIIEMIGSRIPKTSNNQGYFTHGQVVALMIINGLGYTTSRLRVFIHTYNYYLHRSIKTRKISEKKFKIFESTEENDGFC